MTDMNIVALIGRLVDGAETTTFSNGNSKAKFRIAVNKSVKKEEQWTEDVDYFDVSYYSKSTELMKYLTKGRQIGIKGSLKQERWEKDGNNMSKVVIYAESIELLSEPKDSSNHTEVGNIVGNIATGGVEPDYNQPKTEMKGPESFVDDDIPF